MPGAVYHMDVRRELDVLRTLKKQIRKIAPRVETYMLNSEGRPMKQRDRKLLRKCLRIDKLVASTGAPFLYITQRLENTIVIRNWDTPTLTLIEGKESK